jgi:hypothetical protein
MFANLGLKKLKKIRLKEMFRIAGIEPSPRLAVRERRLKDVAEFAIDTLLSR